jgi:ABC-type sugar transport system substrate-binding protein
VDLVATVVSTGWASGVNAYLTVALMSVLGRAGWDRVPSELQSDWVLAAALALFAVEFVVDKVPYLDSAWDSVHTAIRPAVGSLVGVAVSGDAGSAGIEEVLAGGGSGAMALASHAVKAGLRLGVNASPEPASNVLVSLVEDGLVAGVVLLALEHPVPAAIAAVLLLAAGAALVVFLARRIGRAARAIRRRFLGAGAAGPEAPP